jgi:hypothetical protein
VTTTENDTQVGDAPESLNGTVETTEPTVKNPTYLELATAVWKLGYELSSYGGDDMFCVDGVNGFLRAFDLPELVEDDTDADNYIAAWFGWKYWADLDDAKQLAPSMDAALRGDLVRRVRVKLQEDKPKSRDVMNGWLVDLGLEEFAPPAPPRHTGRYDVEYNASTEVNSARIQEALRLAFGERAGQDLNIRVNYVGRVG